MNNIKRKLTLYPAAYQIKVPGHLSPNWSEWDERMTITNEFAGDSSPITTLTGTVDQAALQGLLRRIYAMGLPLISVKWLEDE